MNLLDVSSGYASGLDQHMERLYEVEAAYLERPDEVTFHFLGAWLVDEWFHDLIFSPQITVPISQLLGSSRVRFWHDQVFYKPPRHPGVVPWHQDYSYWTRALPPNHITINILLDDATLENGCLALRSRESSLGGAAQGGVRRRYGCAARSAAGRSATAVQAGAGDRQGGRGVLSSFAHGPRFVR